MTDERIKQLLALLALLALAGCGESGFAPAGNVLAIKVTGTQSFNPAIDHGVIDKYRVTVEGLDIEKPIVAVFDGDADEGLIDGVPAGDNRQVSVEAINLNSVVIRAGETAGVHVGGGVTEVVVDLEAVPIFTNLASGNVVENTRLVMRIFADPAHPVIVEDLFGRSPEILADASSGLSQIHTDRSTGKGVLIPPLLPPGEHGFVIRDAVTHRSSEVSILLLPGARRRPAPFVAAGVAGRDECQRLVSSPWWRFFGN